jgi:hypothetical protein
MKDVDAILRSALLATLDRDLDRAEALLAEAVRIDSSGIESCVCLGGRLRCGGGIGGAVPKHPNQLFGC